MIGTGVTYYAAELKIPSDHSIWDANMNRERKNEIQLLDTKYGEDIREMCNSGDAEIDHGLADKMIEKLLHELGMTQTLAEYRAVDKWYA